VKPTAPTIPETAARRERTDDALLPDALTRRCAAYGGRAVGAALALIALAGGLYLSGVLPSRRPLGRVSGVWHLSAAEAAAALDAAAGPASAAGGWEGHRLAEAALLLLQAPVGIWLLLLACDAIRRKDGLAVGMVLALLLVWLAAALGWWSPSPR